MQQPDFYTEDAPDIALALRLCRERRRNLSLRKLALTQYIALVILALLSAVLYHGRERHNAARQQQRPAAGAHVAIS